MAYQLLQTNIALTGNVKLCCYINDGEVTKATMNPLSTITPITPQSINLKNSKYERDIVDFYSTYKDIFYDPQIKSRLANTNIYKKFVDDDYWETGIVSDCQYGCKRVSLQKNGKQFALLAPIWITSQNDIPSSITFELSLKDNVAHSLTIPITDKLIGNYLSRSYNDFTDNACKIMNVTLNNDAQGIGRSTLRGWSTTNAGLVNITNSNLPQRIFSQDLTYTEFDSYICDEFKNHELVIPHILNLSWYFNIDDLMNVDRIEIESGTTFEVNAYYKDSNGDKIQIADLDFNHYNIPGITSLKDKTFTSRNILDYLHEYDIESIRDNVAEHLVPTISKWALSESGNSYKFNAFLGYNGFTNNDNEYVYPKGNSYSFDIYEKNAIKELNNLSWLDCLSKDTNRQTSIISKPNSYNTAFAKSVIEGTSYLTSPGSLKNIYYNTSNLIDRNCVIDNQIICNGLKLTIKDNMIAKLLSPTSNVVNGTKISMSYIDNSATMTDSKSVTPSLFILYKIEENEFKTIDFVFWLPYNTNGDIYNISDSDYADLYTIFNVFISGSTTFNLYAYKINSVTDWELQSDLGYRIGLNTIFTLNVPSYYMVNKKLYSQMSGSQYKLYQTPNVSIEKMMRYYGWIQPSFIFYNETSDGYVSTDNDYLFIKKIDGDVNIGEDYGDSLSAIVANNGIVNKYILGDQFVEGKWFFKSKISYIPKTISKCIDVDSNKSKSIEDVLGEILKNEFTDDTSIKYFKRQYNVTWDMNEDRSQYIIKMNLK